MKLIKIITAKIKPDIYKLILTGKKIFELTGCRYDSIDRAIELEEQ